MREKRSEINTYEIGTKTIEIESRFSGNSSLKELLFELGSKYIKAFSN